MRVITERDLIRGVLDEWVNQYGEGGRNAPPRLRHVFDALRALDLETATADQVDAIIGNRSWTVLHCDECGGTPDTVVEFDGEDGGDEGEPRYCLPCLHKAVALAEEHAKETA